MVFCHFSHIAVYDHIIGQQIMDSNDLYSCLPQPVLSVADRIGLDRKVSSNMTESFVKNRLPKSIFESDIRFTTYLLSEGTNTRDRNKSKPNKCPNGLNAKQRRQLFNISKDKVKYETFEKINVLWHSYIDSIMDECKSASDQIKLIRADFHGSYFIISAAKNTSLVGIKGFVVQETKNTFKIINKENRLLTVPKDGTIFAFEHNGVISKLNGFNLKMSSHHRSKVRPKLRKFISDI